jgi:hypothetical protein
LTFAQLGEHATHREQAGVIRRYIIWRNSHTYDERIRHVIMRRTLPGAVLGEEACDGGLDSIYRVGERCYPDDAGDHEGTFRVPARAISATACGMSSMSCRHM